MLPPKSYFATQQHNSEKGEYIFNLDTISL